MDCMTLVPRGNMPLPTFKDDGARVFAYESRCANDLCISVDDMDALTDENARLQPSEADDKDDSKDVINDNASKRSRENDSAEDDGSVSLASCEAAFHVSKRPKIETIDYSFAYPDTASHLQLTGVHDKKVRFFFTPYGSSGRGSAVNHLALQYPFVAAGTFETVESKLVVSEKTQSTPATPRLVNVDP
ncbi:hypothetical protein THRCLA_00761 [Thraustotheca clavata]|uniref:Uncharacterized protein n=1 Tax=Thraustotheca clavata TaxID=74557 RepID=A0A1W0AAM2_9STRA|nr:hypothetical protein THRCLA_00761 [Thraustotheca clavata]